jgi:glycosyltransferase involved in cell wall biosynthesis
MVEQPGKPVVLHVSQPVNGGVAKAVRQLAHDQSARGWSVRVATPPEGELGVRLGGLAVPWRTGPLSSPHLLGEARDLLRIVERVRPDIVHLHSSKAGLAGRLSIRGRIATVFQPHSWSFDAARGRARQLALGWERFASRWADVILCVSAAERERGIEHGIRGRFTVIANGIDRTSFPPIDAEGRAAARERLGLLDTPVVLCVGRLTYQKGQDVLLGAWPRVSESVPEARLVLVGDGEDADVLRSAAPPAVEFAGSRDDVFDWLAAADVVVLPSRWEGMSFVLLEALATGCSVVATDVAGSREALDGAGAIVPVGDYAALGAAVVERLRNPGLREAEQRQAAERARDFDLKRTLNGVAGLYDDILAERSRPAT